MKKLRVLVGCEESQAVCIEFRKLGHEAYSCDLQECSGGHPEWHLQMDVFEAIEKHGPWDLGIFFPPCTHIANAGGSWFAQKRKDGRQREAIIFFMRLHAAPIDKIALENPVGILSSDTYIYKHFPDLLEDLEKVGMPRKPDQVIQPFYFGDPVRKYTCLWLKGLKPLKWVVESDMFDSSNFVFPQEATKTVVRKGNYRPGSIRKLYWQDLLPKKDRAKIKSKTFPGIAKSMALQWGGKTEIKEEVNG